MEFDLQYIKELVTEAACMVIYTGLTEGQEIRVDAAGNVKALDRVGKLIR